MAALIKRERITRFSGGVFGPLWAFATPIVWIIFVLVTFRLLGRASPFTAGAELFVATGILPYILFRQTITSMMRTLVANRYLRYFQPINGQDILLAAAIAELLNAIITSILVFGAIYVLFGPPMPTNILFVYLAMALAWALGASAGSLFSALGQWSDSVARAVPLALRPMFWISGIFYIAAELPGPVQELLWWNPLFHVIELLREGFFLGYSSPVSDPWYVCLVIALLYLASVSIERFVIDTNRGRFRL